MSHISDLRPKNAYPLRTVITYIEVLDGYGNKHLREKLECGHLGDFRKYPALMTKNRRRCLFCNPRSDGQNR